MYLDYSKLPFDKDGIPETPTLVLKTLDGSTVGVIPGAHNITLNIKYAEPSEISFDVPAVIDEKTNWIYDQLTGYMVIYTEHYGVYITMNPNVESDGISDIKHITGYSLEKELETKKFFLEEGTIKFYDSTNPTSEDTIMGRIFEIALGWKAGYISPAVAQRYRTFEQYDDYLLSFVYGTAPEKYRCVFVFDPYEKTISVYDTDSEYNILPLYLDFDNLLKRVDVEELSTELATAIRVYGADELSIHEVNPIGTEWIYDLGYFIAKGDISGALADKWQDWQKSIQNNMSLYEGLSALRASATIQLLAKQAELTDLEGELDTLNAEQSVTIQALALEKTDDGKASQQAVLDGINKKITAKNEEIARKKTEISEIEDSLDAKNPESYVAQINRIVKQLGIRNYFTDDEYSVLSHYFIEQDITEETFVATDIDVETTGANYQFVNENISISDSSITQTDLPSALGKTMYTISGGRFVLNGTLSVSGDIIRGTLETSGGTFCVLSLYAGSITVGDAVASSGVITISGEYNKFVSDIEKVQNITTDNNGNQYEITEYLGSCIQFTSDSGSMYLTTNISDYQKYSVQKELYDYAVDVLSDLSSPTYEFSVDSGNFLFSSEFAPFRNKLELGCGVYLNMGGKQIITPYIIEFEVSFEDRSKFSIIFSNRFKRHDNVNTLKDMIEKSYSSSRSFDASKYLYNQTAAQSSQVSKFMKSSLDTAVNTILAAPNQSVIINGTGITIGNGSKYQIRMVNEMIAMTDNNWETAKLAIGHFASEEIGEYFGINAEVVGGKLIVGNNLVIENTTDKGVMQFKVDSSGAWLNNSTLVLQKDDGGKILIDPRYGIVAGSGNLYQTSGTTVLPSFIDGDGDIIYDNEGLPDGSNFYLDIQNGDAYFRGKLLATSGKIGGFTIDSSYLYSGTGGNRVAINGGTDYHSPYAFWAGAEDPANAPFWVKKNGEMKATNATFSGTINASKLAGDLVADDDTDGWLRGCGISVGGNYKTGAGNFYVDSNGNVSMKGSIELAGSITFNGKTYTGLQDAVHNLQYRDTYTPPDYIKRTYIDSAKLVSPEIYAGHLYATGKGSDNQAAFYICDGVTGDGANLRANDPIGYISYDTNGAGTSSEARERVFFTTLHNTALKIEASGNMSISAASFIYVPTLFKAVGGLTIGSAHFGSSPPSTGENGQLFFVV